MPNLGDIRSVKGQRQVWSACIDCGKRRWVLLKGGPKGNPTFKARVISGTPRNLRCLKCATKLRPLPVWNYFKEKEANPQWRGGRRVDVFGYIKIRVYPDSPYYPMVDKIGYVAEHRLVMAQHLGRCLLGKEYVHHKDRNKQNNEIQNLELTDIRNHNPVGDVMKELEALKLENQRLRLLLQSNHKS